MSLNGKSHGQPVGSSVKDLRSCLQGVLKDIAKADCPVHCLVGVKCEEVDIPWTGKQNGQQVTDSHGQQNCVGGGRHADPAQHPDDQAVGHKCYQHQQRHEVTIERLNHLYRT